MLNLARCCDEKQSLCLQFQLQGKGCSKKLLTPVVNKRETCFKTIFETCDTVSGRILSLNEHCLNSLMMS